MDVKEAIDFLVERGYSVTPPGGFWREHPREFMQRIGISYNTFWLKINKPECPPFEHEKGKRRVLWLISNPMFEHFMRKKCKIPSRK